jgi:hypothetical protein
MTESFIELACVERRPAAHIQTDPLVLSAGQPRRQCQQGGAEKKEPCHSHL